MSDCIGQMTETLLKALNGDPDADLLSIDTPGELRPLVHAMDRVVTALRRQTVAYRNIEQTLNQSLARCRHLEETIPGSAKAYRMLFENNPMPMLVYDQKALSILAVNQAATQLYGYSYNEFVHMTIRDIRPPEDVPRLLHTMKTLFKELNAAGQWRHCKKDGTIIDVEIFSHTITFEGHRARMVLVRDVTENKRLEKQLLQSQKMEAIGLLAGGVAHDFNNMLSVIIGYVELIKTRIAADDPMVNDIAEIEGAAIRSRDTARQLLAFSRKQIISPKVIDLNAQIDQMHKTLSRLIGETIELVFIPEKNLWHIVFDPSQVDQVLVNLSINARDAMPQGGQLTIETGNIHLDQAFCNDHLGCTPGDYVLVKISDTGTGIDPQILDHVFEPFFTTKEVGKGTGLGLATVYGIVKQNKGFVQVTSKPGIGTEFRIHIPADLSSRNIVEKTADTAIAKGAGTILLVEDDDMVRRMVAAMLNKIGYRVIPRATPLEALIYFQQADAQVDLLLTDVVMSEMSGTELRDQVKTIRPTIKVLYMSGYTSNVIVRHGMLDQEVHFIQKPFTLRELVAKVRAAIADDR